MYLPCALPKVSMYVIDVPEAEQWARGPLVWASALARYFILQLWCVSFVGVVSHCDLEASDMVTNSAFLWNEWVQ